MRDWNRSMYLWYSGSCSKSSCLTKSKNCLNSQGKSPESSAEEVCYLISQILVFSSCLFLHFCPCQGRDPLSKYKRTYARVSRSSLLDCSTPRWVLIETYLAVPVRPFPTLCLMCSPLEFMNFLARPKSIRKIQFSCPALPRTRFSGLMSL